MGLPLRGGRRRPRGGAAAVRRGPARLPAWPASPASPPAGDQGPLFGTAVRCSGDATQSFLAITNDSPYPIRLAGLLEAPQTAVVEDLGRGFRLAPAAEAGGRNLVLDLLPFGVSAIRVGAPRVRVASVTAYPSEAVLAGMQAQSRDLALRLARLNQGVSAVATEPANPGFEPAADPPMVPGRPRRRRRVRASCRRHCRRCHHRPIRG